MQATTKMNDGKRKFALWVKESTLDLTKKHYKDDNCSSQSEFIAKAIHFYAGYIDANRSSQYLASVLISTMKSIIAESDNRNNRMMFKLAVELAMTMNVLAATQHVDKATLDRLRGECVKEVKRLNGTFSFEDAVDWQRG